MNKPSPNFDNSEAANFEERQLWRLEKYEFIERSIAEHMAEKGHMRMFDKEIDLDASGYPYPFGKAGAAKLTLCELTDASIAHIQFISLSESTSNSRILMKLIPAPLASVHRDRIVFTEKGALRFIEEGRRDILVALNTGLLNPADVYEPGGRLELDNLHKLRS